MWMGPMHRLPLDHESEETLLAVSSSVLASMCFSNGILLWENIYFPTTGTLSAGPIRLAQPLQLPVPLQGEIISPRHTQLLYLVLPLGIFKANAFGSTRRLQNLTAVTRPLLC